MKGTVSLMDFRFRDVERTLGAIYSFQIGYFMHKDP